MNGTQIFSSPPKQPPKVQVGHPPLPPFKDIPEDHILEISGPTLSFQEDQLRDALEALCDRLNGHDAGYFFDSSGVRTFIVLEDSNAVAGAIADRDRLIVDPIHPHAQEALASLTFSTAGESFELREFINFASSGAGMGATLSPLSSPRPFGGMNAPLSFSALPPPAIPVGQPLTSRVTSPKVSALGLLNNPRTPSPPRKHKNALELGLESLAQQWGSPSPERVYQSIGSPNYTPLGAKLFMTEEITRGRARDRESGSDIQANGYDLMLPAAKRTKRHASTEASRTLAADVLNDLMEKIRCELWVRLSRLTMQQAVLQHFPKCDVTYTFTNRSKDMLFSRECFELVKTSIDRLAELKLQDKEVAWLKESCPYFTDDYIAYLESYRFRPKEQVKIGFHVTKEPNFGQISIEISGLWVETILYEVPVMSILSEAYFLKVDREWSYEGQEELAYEKAKKLIQGGLSFSDFGTRRRRSYHGQDLVIQGLIRAHKEFSGTDSAGRFSSTSNPHFAMKYGLATVGTIAHEWIMGIAATRGYENANGIALDLWEATYPTTKSNVLHTALTDTFSTEAFIANFITDVERAKRWRGLRQDSGDPIGYIPKARGVYEKLGIDPGTKTIVFSDGLDVESSLNIKKEVDKAGMLAAFGIGTFLTNDYKRLNSNERSMPLNMVIKLSSIEGKPCVKISDEISKNTGDPSTVNMVKETFRISA
ncbi:nicotinate phosphoribosyltransferase [Ceratobasidium sp. AG-Ba]|nr:nicotinate phosphoribosyltransferase [Ceratobasidium sp. AG-Ba]